MTVPEMIDANALLLPLLCTILPTWAWRMKVKSPYSLSFSSVLVTTALVTILPFSLKTL